MEDFIHGVMNLFSPSPSPEQVAQARSASQVSDQAAFAAKGLYLQPDGSYSSVKPGLAPSVPMPTTAPTASPVTQFVKSVTQPPSGGFHYLMGSHDYSSIAPQVQQVLKGTPLEPYANNFIQAGNEYGVDPRVLLTVANNESSLGRNYPKDSYNPFGYNAGGAGNVTGPDGKQYVNVDQGLRNAGFTSVPMAIDRLTNRFSRQPTSGYQQFYKDPSVENLQAAYNANPAEQQNYIKNASALVSQFK